MTERHFTNRSRTGRNWLPLAIGCTLLTVRLAAATFVATLNQNTAEPGEAVQLALTFQGGKPDQVPAIPSVPNLAIAYQGPSSQYSVVNGRVSSSVTFNYAVTASQPGEYIIPAIRAVVDGQTLASQPLKLAVGKSASGAAQIAFLSLVPPRTEAVLGEAMLFEIQLFAQGGRLERPPQLKGDGVTIGKLRQGAVTQVLTNGIPYQRLTYEVPVTFVKTGEFTLSAGDCLLTVQFRRPDDFFGFGSESRQLNLSSEPITIRVQPLPPDNQPPDFSGAIGDYTLVAGLSTNTVTAGDPITLTVRISGRGSIDTLQWRPPPWPGFKTYAPSSSVQTTNDFGLTGTKTFEQAIIPESPQVKQVPPITFSYFDPERRQYRTASQPAIPITVHPATALTAQPVIIARPGASQPEQKINTEIVHIKTRPGTFARITTPLVERGWFLGLQTLPALAWLTAFVWRRRADQLANNPRLRRRREVSRGVREGLEELRNHAQQSQGDAFYATTFRLLQEQLGERLDLPSAAITEAVVEERLRPLGADASLLAATRELFQLCDQARYAPSHKPGELTAILDRVRTTLEQLQSLTTDARR